MQRNRFEHLNGRFVPDDQIGVKKQGDDGSNDTVRKDQYKYALGNENVIDAHVYQINPNLPKSFGGTVMARHGTFSEHSICSILWKCKRYLRSLLNLKQLLMIQIHGIGQFGTLTKWPSIIKISSENLSKITGKH